MSTERVIVQRSIVERFRTALDTKDRGALETLLAQGKRHKDALSGP